MFKCEVCPAEFKTQKGLDNHKCRWICNHCGKKLATAKGHERHVKNHGKQSENRIKIEASKVEKQRLQVEKYDFLKSEIIKLGLFNPNYKVGDTVFISTYYVTKPTHEWRGTRLVHVRYEEDRIYRGLKTTITEVSMSTSCYSLEFSIKENKSASIYYRVNGDNKQFGEDSFYPSMELAEKDATATGLKYKESCDFASMCR
jgi:hypothetical protein